MDAAVFMGSELYAAGFRLAGLDAHAPEPSSAAALFEKLLAQHPALLLVGESCVTAVGPARIRSAVSQAAPPVLVIADQPGQPSLEELAAEVRAELGVA